MNIQQYPINGKPVERVVTKEYFTDVSVLVLLYYYARPTKFVSVAAYLAGL
jgi:hypothetical protein